MDWTTLLEKDPSLLTNEEIKLLRRKKDEILRVLRINDESSTVKNILENEKKYLGKCYKYNIPNNYSEETETKYFKVLSTISNMGDQLITVEFVLPISPKFSGTMRLNCLSKYDYSINDEDIIWFDKIPVNGICGLEAGIENKKYIEITKEEFLEAFKKLFTATAIFIDKTYPYDMIFGDENA